MCQADGAWQQALGIPALLRLGLVAPDESTCLIWQGAVNGLARTGWPLPKAELLSPSSQLKPMDEGTPPDSIKSGSARPRLTPDPAPHLRHTPKRAAA